MNATTYSTQKAADDATEYAAARALLKHDPEDEDAQATIDQMNEQYGEGFFEN